MISRADLMQLIEVREGPCVSLFMPTHRAGQGKREDGIRHKNLLRDAQQQLDAQGVDQELAAVILKPVADLTADADIWDHRGDGLAVFSAPGFFRALPLPATIVELVLVDEHFHVSPLISMLHENQRFFILSLSKDSADLFEATRNSMAECDLPALAPLVVDGPEPAHQFHSQHAPTQGKGDNGEAIFHGQGGAGDREKAGITNFFKRQVEPEVAGVLRGEDAPLVLVCVDYLAPIYRAANSYRRLLDGHVSGSPSEYSEEVLQESAWKLVEPLAASSEKVARSKFRELRGSDRAIGQSQPVLESARNGRVETLFVPKDIAARTNLPPSNGKATAEIVHIVEEAAEWTLRNGGQVLAVEEVPGDSSLAAVLRY